MKLKLDENLSRHLKPRLVDLGYDVATTADEQLLSQPDTVVAAAARAEGRVLLTLDIEFADLRKYRPGTHPGIILFRPSSVGPLIVNRLVEDFVRTTNLKALSGCVMVVESTRVRIRRPSTDV